MRDTNKLLAYIAMIVVLFGLFFLVGFQLFKEGSERDQQTLDLSPFEQSEEKREVPEAVFQLQ